ncbi:hypothetical protein ACIPY3_02550 [Paenarthrobacter sp. NPDC089714]|uniref:hypothetical protein n=1 Tax=Paenarthrobacter sp. NPDC089714 TaxID=3364377 RepID=UPI00382452BB
MSSEDARRCLHCDQTKEEIRKNETICGIVSGYEYQELIEEWPKHRWADWKDHELPPIIRTEFRHLHRRTQVTQFEWLPCEHTTIGHKYPETIEDLEYFDAGRCIFCGHKQSKELVPWCPHVSYSGAERPVEEMGRMPVLWSCDSCGHLEVIQ